MRTVAIFKNSRNQAIRIPKDMEFQGVLELEIRKDGDTLILRPARPSWTSLQDLLPLGEDFLAERQDVIEEGRFNLDEGKQ
ncbi:AbrB/MazE/SpoVT family DNA-binding domain-containing protein [Collimonas pratensis]|uniref:type II toxin-antitoxin system VapB family antitoxin n=1 Tax=Collimonas pratensis TaxID=279113 RepID=UPI00143D6956|nr:type II toxin-antitoxin system VapB family antitoxin [Collimonas pratensis]NKI70651.1 AbrB/MazE/SpoVT family DNA-binding domain-containing protein [Collimonas pratensis]